MIRIVCATTRDALAFEQTPLGRSLHQMEFDSRLVTSISFNNAEGLPKIYNAELSVPAEVDDILVFIHDDVWIDDYFLADRITDGVAHFDIVGVAGNRRLSPNHRGWLFPNDDWTWDTRGNRSGVLLTGYLLLLR